MPIWTRTALLAVAALGAVALAAVRITSAAEHKTIVVEEAPRVREVTLAQAAATLTKLHPPPGFRVRACHERADADKCFWTPRVFAVGTRTMRRIVVFERARPSSGPLDGCLPAHHYRAGLVLRACAWGLELGRELVMFTSTSLLAPPGKPKTRIARKVLSSWRRGTEIEMTVIGHWPHDKVPSERFLRP
jgi:hypothetical protein